MMENIKSNYQRGFFLICVTQDGIPLFSRNFTNIESSIPFSHVGPLNAAYMFTSSKDILLEMTSTPNSVTVWKTFEEVKLILIAFNENLPSNTLSMLLTTTYNAMVMTCGEADFLSITNVEKLKKKIKLAFPLIKSILNSPFHFGSISQTVDVCIVSHSSILLQYLQTFTEECESEFGCLLVNHKIAVATEQFWHLHSMESCLIVYLCSTLHTEYNDIPIYLPYGSSKVPHRLIVIELLNHVKVALVCGPEPSLQKIVKMYVKKYWMNIKEVLLQCIQTFPKEVPNHIKIDENVLGYIFLNNDNSHCMTSFYPSGSMTGADQDFMANAQNRRDALFDFYCDVCELNESVDTNENIMEQYSCSKKSKACFISMKANHLFVLFKCDCPTYIIKNISKQLMKQLFKECRSHIS